MSDRVARRGAPFLMAEVQLRLSWLGVQPYFAFSQRQSVEVIEDGQTVKRSTFKHMGFVRP